MRILDVITKCELFIENARNASNLEFLCEAENNLVKMRELLDRQPELKHFVKAGSAKSSEGSTMWEHLH